MRTNGIVKYCTQHIVLLPPSARFHHSRVIPAQNWSSFTFSASPKTYKYLKIKYDQCFCCKHFSFSCFNVQTFKFV